MLDRVGLLAAGGCSQALGPDYYLPEKAAFNRSEFSHPLREADAQTYISAPLPAHWWRLYDDARLDRLIARALQGNASLREAMANLERVQAVRDEVAGASRPSISVSGGPGFGHASGLSHEQAGVEPANAWQFNASTTVSYQLDLFGQLKRAQEAAAANSEAAKAAMERVKITVVAATVGAYSSYCSGGLQLRSAQRSLDLQRQASAVTLKLQQAGHTDEVDALRASAQERQLSAAIPPLQARRSAALYRLAAITGQPMASLAQDLADCDSPPQLSQLIPVGDGAALLRRRPDIREAERNLAAATARIGVAVADLYPKVSLGLSAGSAGPMPHLGRNDAYGWSVGPLISWSVPNNGVARARISQAQANAKAFYARFDSVVLNALEETETALNSYARELDHHHALEAARQENEAVAHHLRLLYRNGKVSYLEALDAERTLAGSESSLAASTAKLSSDQVNLFLALGGGWRDSEDQL